MNEYGQKRITLEKALRAYQETGIKPIWGNVGRVVDGRVVEGCVSGAIGVHEGLLLVPHASGCLLSMWPWDETEMNIAYGTHYLTGVKGGFDAGFRGRPYRDYGFNGLGYGDGYEIGEYIRCYGVPKLVVPDYAPVEVEKECVA